MSSSHPAGDKLIHTPTEHRLITLDVLRGFALLGILVMNIQVMAMIGISYSNPTSFGDLTGANYWVWCLSHVLFDQKMISIFSLLFGAGIAMMADRAEARTGRSAMLHYRRMFWLFLFGMAHAYLIWFGDILVSYAICGSLVYMVLRLKPALLLAIGLGLLIVPNILYMGAFVVFTQLAPTEIRNEFAVHWNPSPEVVQAEIEAYQGSWLQQQAYRGKTAVIFQTFLFGIWTFWRVSGLMAIGIACYRWNILNGQRSDRFYGTMSIAGLVLGFPLVILGVQQNFANDWEAVYSTFIGFQYNYIGSVFVAMGYVGLIMLIVKHRLLPELLQTAVASVGRMALSNYILQSLIGTLIFYGHGLGWFGQFTRTEQIYLVLAIWAFQLVISPMWLIRFRYGPAEWLWRKLTYGSVKRTLKAG